MATQSTLISFLPRVPVIRTLIILFLFTFTSIILLSIWIDTNRWSRWRLLHLIHSSSDFQANSLSDNLDFSVFSQKKSELRLHTKSRHFKSFGTESYFTWSLQEQPWFMDNGSYYPDPVDPTFSRLALLPEDAGSDRIINQLMYLPENYDSIKFSSNKKLKKILLYFDKGSWGQDLPSGRSIFVKDRCPVNTCEIIFDTKYAYVADAVLFKDHFIKPKHTKPAHQIWILYVLECPLHTPPFRGLNELINWTATYRHDSDIVTPYEKFVSFDPEIKTNQQQINYAQGKTKKVAWFVSNCAARNKRLEYAKELSKYIDVDIYGRCGKLQCSRNNADECFDKLDKEYKFYLAFENSNCHDYITEKFFSNGLSHNIIPIVMGAHPDDYRRSAPFNSYIHVNDFNSPKELALYLKKLDQNDTLYNQYFTWKGTGQFINTHFWCRLCAMLHAPVRPKFYENLSDWWFSQSVCSSDNWL